MVYLLIAWWIFPVRYVKYPDGISSYVCWFINHNIPVIFSMSSVTENKKNSQPHPWLIRSLVYRLAADFRRNTAIVRMVVILRFINQWHYIYIWFITVYYGLLWFIMVYIGLYWFIITFILVYIVFMVYIGLFIQELVYITVYIWFITASV